jgi:abortive infection alpha-like protein
MAFMNDSVEILKSGAVDKAADLLHRLAAPAFDHFGAIFADKVLPYRAKNLVATLRKTERILREAGLPANAVPTRLLLPIMEASSIEDNETLQEMWAGLLATASHETDSVSPSFVETLKQLTPDEARYLQRLNDDVLKERQQQRHANDEIWKKVLEKNPEMAEREKSVAHAPIPATALPPGVRSKSQIGPDTYERLGLIQRRYDVDNKPSGDALADSGYVPIYRTDLVYQFVFTEYAAKFLRACQGPSAAGSGSDASTA